jgi:hypothetical protein
MRAAFFALASFLAACGSIDPTPVADTPDAPPPATPGVIAHELPDDGPLNIIPVEILLNLLLPDRHYRSEDFAPVQRTYDQPEVAACLYRHDNPTCAGTAIRVAREYCDGNVLLEIFDGRLGLDPDCNRNRWFYYTVDCADYCFDKYPGWTGACVTVDNACEGGVAAGRCECRAGDSPSPS